AHRAAHSSVAAGEHAGQPLPKAAVHRWRTVERRWCAVSQHAPGRGGRRRYRRGMNVDVTPLPGIGVRKDFQTSDGRRVGVVSTREGTLDLIVSKADDPDASELCLALTPKEAVTLSSLLGAPQLLA